jgi:hypothetical protein
MEQTSDPLRRPAGGPGMVNGSRPRVTPQLLIGLIVIAVGVLFTLENLRIIEDADEFLRYWPAGVVAVGLLKIWQSWNRPGSALGGVLITMIGTWLLLEQAAVIRISFWELWPLLLVFVGAYLVWHGVAGPRPRDAFDSTSTMSALAVMGGIARGNNSPAFRGGDLTAIMGGCEVDLRQASINGDAVLDIFALMGGVEIRVPETWTVVSRIVPFMAAVDDQTRPPQTAGVHRLVLRGFIMMAAVEVKN